MEAKHVQSHLNISLSHNVNTQKTGLCNDWQPYHNAT